MTAQAGTFQPSSNGNGAASSSGQDGSLGLPEQDLSRKDSHGGGSEMRATINDIQNHLDEMHSSNVGAPTGGAIVREANGAAPPPPPPLISRNYSIDETSSLASRSTRDDASSIRDQEGGFDGQRTSTGTAMAPHAKENLARNIQLAQEREERQRSIDEQEREAERERMRLSSGPPVEGLVLTDESDIEEDSDDDDSIFPVRKRTSDDFARGMREQDEADEDARVPTPAQEETPHVGQQQNGRFSPAIREPTTSPLPAATSSSTIIEQDEDSSYPTPAIEETEPPLEQVRVPTPSDQSALPQSADRRSSEDTQGRSQAATASVLGAVGAAAMVRDGTAKPTKQNLAPSPQIQQEDHTSRRGSVESEQFVVSKRDTPVDMSSPECSPIASASQPARGPASGSRYSTDAAPPGQEGLLTIVEHAQTQSPVILNPPRHSTASSTNVAQPVSPYQSTAGSSRAGSTLGTALTPATSAGFEPSPRSATFPSRTPTLSDPTEWNIDQVIEWGQSKNFDNQVLGKFRGMFEYHLHLSDWTLTHTACACSFLIQNMKYPEMSWWKWILTLSKRLTFLHLDLVLG